MKKRKIVYLHQWKLQSENFRSHKIWATNAHHAFTTMKTVLAGQGYKNSSFYRISAFRYIIKSTKQHKYGEKIALVIATKLRYKKLKDEIKTDYQASNG